VSLVPYPDVRARVLAAVTRLDRESLPLGVAVGLALADEIVCTEPVPPFANTAMDGYAVRAADTAGAAPDAPVTLRVVDELPAGRPPTSPVGPGEAIRIMTGAPIPSGADAIVIVERTEPAGEDAVNVHEEAASGAHIRAAGGDLDAGSAVFPAGTVITPAHVGVLASLGYAQVPVVRRARVGVVSTGDELVPPGGPALEVGQIRDSNRPMLLALAGGAGAEVVDLGIARDDEGVTERVLDDALVRCDVVLTSGGVSMGEYDYVKAVLDRRATRAGDEFAWLQVAIKPAKPFAFGALGGVPVFGLPGNPVSALVSFELFARPAILQAMGHPHRFRPEIDAVAAEPMRRKPDGKVHLDRVRVAYDAGRYVAARTGVQESNVLSATAAANGLALIPDGDGIDAGDPVTVMRLDAPADH
jgi:molybdenum cofactor synthesis domain-containing protein